MINYTNQVIKTITLSNTIELTDEQLAGVVGGHDEPRHDHDWDRGEDRRGHDDDDWNHRYWGWRHGWR